MIQKTAAVILALITALTLTVPVLAAPEAQVRSSADLLYDLGLFRGVGTNPDGTPNFALGRAPNRAEAGTILVRLLGAEQEALSHPQSMPFQDVPNWAKPYVGYAYNKGYTKGVDAHRFASASPVTAAQQLTFVLRSLGYQDGSDFYWASPWALSDQLKLTNGEFPDQKTFSRGDTTAICANALYAPLKGTDMTLLESLTAAGAITKPVVIWDYDAVAFSGDYASFLFYPVQGSPALFTQFKLNKVTVNGLACDTLQVNTPDAVSAYLASIGYNAGGFGYVEVSYPETEALKAATKFRTDAKGKKDPLLAFSFQWTGKQADGTTVSGTFTDYYYIDKDGE